MKPTNSRSFFGKYRGTVYSNNDPKQLGRLMVIVPDVLGSTPSNWAEPCVPLAGKGEPMGVFLVPPVGAGVWVEFEHGSAQDPIWVGCRWGTSSDLPAAAKQGSPDSPSIVLQSKGRHSIVISDKTGPDGGITLKSSAGVSVVINDNGIFLKSDNGTVSIKGTVNVNDGALTVSK
jgi:uncharacterized protein involved in type VI secretion and phage assembly